jgi:hypothetical protein
MAHEKSKFDFFIVKIDLELYPEIESSKNGLAFDVFLFFPILHGDDEFFSEDDEEEEEEPNWDAMELDCISKEEPLLKERIQGSDVAHGCSEEDGLQKLGRAGQIRYVSSLEQCSGTKMLWKELTGELDSEKASKERVSKMSNNAPTTQPFMRPSSAGDEHSVLAQGLSLAFGNPFSGNKTAVPTAYFSVHQTQSARVALAATKPPFAFGLQLNEG